ncbi:DUF1996 domain-containing protein [Streptacidiphilus sp. ASG 303]|uniref:DUF1996 domain-containing protein n=1 Tax=Streptacidiphilus sp. ASG 303 TaxID=2896847 RepID=UPI001E652655|nr:DUF1996 domain-containing protein [Streptacidiphilus sp. ASG 303]MCD0485600.1 DUF1996 domain-containing protein [Streptacidiphilus sp. ASG 303]
MSQHQRARRRGRTVAIGVAAALALGGGGYAAFTASANADDNVAGATIACPRVNEMIGAVPAQAQNEVNSNLALLDQQVAEANRRLASSQGQGGPNFVQNAILGPLRDKRVSTLDRIAIAIGRTGAQRPQGLQNLADCSLQNGGGQNQGGQNNGGQNQGGQNQGSADAGQVQGNQGQAQNGAGGIACPDVKGAVGNVPARAQNEVNRNLALLDRQVAEADRRLASSQGQGGPNFVQNAILGPLKSKRVATLDRIAIAIGRTGAQRPRGLNNLAACALQNGGQNQGGQNQGGQNGGGQNNGNVNAGQNNGGNQNQGGGISPDGFANGLSAADFADIRTGTPANDPNLAAGPASGTFTSNCGVSDHNNPANFIVAPGVANGAHHVHDYVGNRTSDGFSTNDSLLAGGTTCAEQQDKSAYYWPVLRLTRAGDQGDANELGGQGDKNIGTKLRASSVKLEFRGSLTAKVVAMPQFLRIITGDAKAAVTNGPANAKAQWSCSNALNLRLKDKYPLCGGARTVRILDFPSCWDGQNTDSANHRTHVVFPGGDGACPNGFRAIPQLRMTLSYQIPQGARFALDSFPEELHKAVTDHGDFVNVMSSELMNKAVNCINAGQNCT